MKNVLIILALICSMFYVEQAQAARSVSRTTVRTVNRGGFRNRGHVNHVNNVTVIRGLGDPGYYGGYYGCPSNQGFIQEQTTVRTFVR